MKNLIVLAILFLFSLSVQAQSWRDKLKAKEDSALKKAKRSEEKVLGPSTPSVPALTNDEVIQGLREALTVGTNSSTSIASQADGYYKNPRLFIPWPEEAKDMKAKLMKMGFEKKITEFETSLNRAAEEAAKNA